MFFHHYEFVQNNFFQRKGYSFENVNKWFDGYIFFQNSCDQDYEYDEWEFNDKFKINQDGIIYSEETGEGLNFTKSETLFTYNGEATSLNFYLKVSRVDGSYSVYVENASPVIEASQFQLLVNDIAINLDKNNTPVDPSFEEWFVVGLAINEGDVLKCRDTVNHNDFTIALDKASSIV